jgi:hypothetical protein
LGGIPRCRAGGAVEFGGDTVRVSRRGVEDRADSRGPLDREMREKRPARKARIKRENVLPQRRHRRTTRWAGEDDFSLWGGERG